MSCYHITPLFLRALHSRVENRHPIYQHLRILSTTETGRNRGYPQEFDESRARTWAILAGLWTLGFGAYRYALPSARVICCEKCALLELKRRWLAVQVRQLWKVPHRQLEVGIQA